MTYPGYDPDPCYHAKDHDTADLCAQWRAAIAAEKAVHEARRASTWSIIATGLNALGLVAVGAALYLTVVSNKITRVIGQAQTRAYVSIISLEGEKRTNGLVFRAKVQNSGQSPALAAQVMLEIIGKDEGKLESFPEHEHQIPAQSSAEMAYCYLKHDTANKWPSIVVRMSVGYGDVFGHIHKVTETFAGSPSKWSHHEFTTLVQGMHVASFLRTMASEETEGDSKD